MPRSYWCSVVALVGLTAAAIGVLGYRELQRAEIDPYPNAHYQPARQPSFPPGWPQNYDPKSGGYEPNCEKPSNKDDSDLCAQWSAVEAVNETNRLTRISLNVSALEFGGLALSLIFTGWAAWAAVKAAAETSNATNLMRLEQRPWLDMEFSVFEKLMLEKKKVSLANITISNTGNSIAFNCCVFAQLYIGGSEAHEANRKELKARLGKWKHPGFSIMPGKTILHTEPIFCPGQIVSATQPESFGVCFVIRYTDYERRNEFFTTKNYMLISRDNMMMIEPNKSPFRNVRAIADNNRTTYE